MKPLKLLILGLILIIPASILASEQEYIKVTDFTNNFSDWKLKEFKGKASYNIKKDEKNHIILTSNQTSFSLAKELRFDLHRYPFLNFEWYVTKLPEDGDVRNKKSDDQAAQLYVIIPSFPEMINFKAIGYIWDSNAPVGTYQSQKTSNIKYIVLKSGKSDLKKWIPEKVNVYEDFKRLWDMNIKEKKIVVSISIDSDDTKSSAQSAFGEIYFSQK